MIPRYEIKPQPLGFGREVFVVCLDGKKITTKETEFDAQVAAVLHEMEQVGKS